MKGYNLCGEGGSFQRDTKAFSARPSVDDSFDILTLSQ